MTKEKVMEMLKLHATWLAMTDEERAGQAGMRADFTKEDLVDFDFSGMDLRYVIFAEANLRRAIFNEADLSHAVFREANLESVMAQHAICVHADFRRANMHNAYFAEAEFKGSDMSGANVYSAYFGGAGNVPYIPMACPEEGAFIGYRKALTGYILVLDIPEDARRDSGTTRKCRCDKARVLRIENLDRTPADIVSVACSFRNDKYDIAEGKGLYYTVAVKTGDTVMAMKYSDDRWSRFNGGIDFYINRQDAVDSVSPLPLPARRTGPAASCCSAMKSAMKESWPPPYRME